MWALAAFCMGFMLSSVSDALELDLRGVGENGLFAEKFVKELNEANAGPDRIAKLEAIYANSTNDEERAEIELEIALIYNQQSGFVDHAKAIEWYDKALVRRLPDTTQAREFILRGNSHEALQHYPEALNDYIRGLLICLRYNLPAKLRGSAEGQKTLGPRPPFGNDVLPPPKPSPAEEAAERQTWADYDRDRRAINEDEQFLRFRYNYVRAIKQMVATGKFSEPDLRKAAERLSSQEEKIEDVLRRVREPNPRPWD